MKKKSKIILFLIFSVSLSGCASWAKFKAKMEAPKKEEEKLIATEEFQVKLEYKEDKAVFTDDGIRKLFLSLPQSTNPKEIKTELICRAPKGFLDTEKYHCFVELPKTSEVSKDLH